jgi:hypothetical protein
MAEKYLDTDQIDRHLAVLSSSQDQVELATSAIALASSANPAAMMVLWRFFLTPEFLARLDVLEDPQRKLTNLRHVLKALEDNASEITGRLCEALATHMGFLSDPDRMMYLLPALGAVRPMSQPAEAVFRSANADGYVNFNGPILVANGSPRALALFEEMVADAAASPADRIDMLHKSVLAHRVKAPVLAACERILGRGLEAEVEAGLVETLFDYQEKPWFGVARFAPMPPPWAMADSGVLESYLRLGRELVASGRMPGTCVQAIERSSSEISLVLAARNP